MFTVFVDDSGTDPKQSVAIASALVIPSDRLIELELEWERLKNRLGFKCFHSSECVYRNPKSEFSGWSECKIKRLLASVRHISKKYGIGAISYAILKKDYDEVMPQEMKEMGGKYHYTWAIRFIVEELDQWAIRGGNLHPLQYIIDWIDPKAEKEALEEVHIVMAQKESDAPGRYQGHYDFKKRCDFPGLQCVDLIAWSCYQLSLFAFFQKPMHKLAERTFWNLERHQKPQNEPHGWLMAVTQERDQLQRWVNKETIDPQLNTLRRNWMNLYRSAKRKH